MSDARGKKTREIEVDVVAYSGYKANERPLYLILQKRKLTVEEVIDRWYGVDHDFFKVLADDGKVYLIRWHRYLDNWSLLKTMERSKKH